MFGIGKDDKDSKHDERQDPNPPRKKGG